MSIGAEVRSRLIEHLQEVREQGGDKLPSERVLAEMFGVSRSTVREALRGLAAQGGVEAQRGSAWVVKSGAAQLVTALSQQLQLGELSQEALLESRVVLEPTIAYLAASRRLPAELAELNRLYLFTSTATTNEEFVSYDTQFHEQLARCTDNGYLVLAVAPLLTTLQRMRSDQPLGGSLQEEILHEHHQILRAVMDGDADGARAAMMLHLESYARNTQSEISTAARNSRSTTTADH